MKNGERKRAAEALPTLTFGRELNLYFNGEDIRLLKLPDGHTDGDVVVFFTKSNVCVARVVLADRRVELGLDDAYEVETLESDDGADLERARQQNIDRIYAEWRGGSHKNAWQSVTSYLAQSAEPLAELRWLYERAKAWPDQRLANRLAQEMLPRLLAERRNGDALDTLRERLRVSADFRPLASADLIRLVQLARDGGDRRVARDLLRDFEHFYPNDPAASVASLLTRQLER